MCGREVRGLTGGARGGHTRGIRHLVINIKNMQLKMEQPRHNTLEEMAQLEKSRTASDKALGDGEADFVFNESGEKKNLLVTERQKDHLRKTMEDTLTAEEVKKEQDSLFKNLLTEKIKDIVSRFVNEDASTRREFWKEIIREIKKEANEKGVEFNSRLETCVCPTCVGEYLVNHGEKHYGEWLQRLASGGNLDWINLKNL